MAKNKKDEKAKFRVSKEKLKDIFANVLKAIAMMIYFVALNIIYVNVEQQEITINIIRTCTAAFLVAGLINLEIAYKKERGDITITAIELLVISLHSLSIMHVIKVYQYDFRIYLLTSSYIISIYYILKSIVLYTKEKKAYLDSFSDISEIVKKDEPVKKEATKKRKPKKKEVNKNG